MAPTSEQFLFNSFPRRPTIIIIQLVIVHTILFYLGRRGYRLSFTYVRSEENYFVRLYLSYNF